ncbi:MAG: cyclic nucleotide-binding protein [Flavipsychrobacter sp.]|nr:cyclic nucleotide-binding protein [Flavipsychrobacter sp.]
MSEILQQHIARFVNVPNVDHAAIARFFQPLELKKKENLLTEGKVCHSNYFVEQGLLRMFFVNDKGVEQTIQFALENWWLADYTSFDNGKPSPYYIQAIEKSAVLAISRTAYDELLQQYPVMERYFRCIHQRAHAAAQFRIKSHYDLSGEEMYRQFSNLNPQFVQRIPQYLLASYLNMTPEYLSEIRSR